VIEFPYLPELEVNGEWTVHSYLNFYHANAAVIVPTAGLPEDEAALAAIQDALPDRTVVGVETPLLTWGGGGVHCITQQVPVAPSAR
jgi:agmatine deiminase